MGSASNASWDISRRETFLLKDDVDMVLSSDQSVWSSIFDVWQLELPTNFGWVQGLWSKLDNLQEFVVSSNISAKSLCWTMGVTQFLDEMVIDETGLAILSFNPSSVQESWSFLGYDVAEQPLLSGLSNMGYRDDDKSYAINRFAHALNNYHLFDNYDTAQEFVMWNQSRDVAHGPWFVTGIYKI